MYYPKIEIFYCIHYCTYWMKACLLYTSLYLFKCLNKSCNIVAPVHIHIVNDNDMSIAENHGGLYQNLALLRKTDGQAAVSYTHLEPRSNQKLKLLYLAKILFNNTDANHDITLDEILNKLHTYDVTAVSYTHLDEDFQELMRFLKMHLIPPDEVHLMPDLFVKK